MNSKKEAFKLQLSKKLLRNRCEKLFCSTCVCNNLDHHCLLVVNNAYGYYTVAANLTTGSIKDLDTYKIILNLGASYTVTSIGYTLFGSPAVVNDNIYPEQM